MEDNLAADCSLRNKPAFAQTRRRILALAVGCALLHTALLAIIHYVRPGGALATVLALSAGAAMVGLLASVLWLGMALRDDEFERQMMVRSALIGTALTLVVTTLWGYAELFAGARPFRSVFTVLLLLYATGLVNLYLRKRYRSQER